MNLLAWAKLMRLPNIPTAAADVLAGFWLARVFYSNAVPASSLPLLVAASCILYAAGMIWNDWFDLEVDSRERPFRPLPSRVISTRAAFIVATFATVIGCALAFAVTVVCGGLTIFLAVAILAYDGGVKRILIAGPPTMGACRTLNLLLGIVGGTGNFGIDSSKGLGNVMLPLVGLCVANGIYIAGVTWFAREEARTSRCDILERATWLMGSGLAVQLVMHWWLAGIVNPAEPFVYSLDPRPGRPDWGFLALWYFFGVLAWLCYWWRPAIRDPSPQHVQSAVKWSVLSLILIDAAPLLCFAPFWQAIVVASLLLPCLVIGRWLYST